MSGYMYIKCHRTMTTREQEFTNSTHIRAMCKASQETLESPMLFQEKEGTNVAL